MTCDSSLRRVVIRILVKFLFDLYSHKEVEGERANRISLIYFNSDISIQRQFNRILDSLVILNTSHFKSLYGITKQINKKDLFLHV